MRAFLALLVLLLAGSALASQVGRDSQGNAFDLFELGDTQTWNFPADSTDDDSRVAPTTFGNTTSAIKLICNPSVHVAQAISPAVATTSNIMLPVSVVMNLAVHVGRSIAVHPVASGAGGACWLTQMR